MLGVGVQEADCAGQGMVGGTGPYLTKVDDGHCHEVTANVFR